MQRNILKDIYFKECQCSKQHCIEQGDLDSAKEFEHQERVVIEMLKQMELEQKATELVQVVFCLFNGD